MKRKILHFLVFVLATNSTFAQWQSLGNDLIPTNHRTWSIKIAPDSSFWAISTFDAFPPTGEVPKVHRSIDNGETWATSELTTGLSDYGWDISPLDSQTAYIAIQNAGLQRTTDGGQTWAKVDSFTLPFCLAVHFFNENDGWVFGSDGVYLVMAVTADGGNSWIYIGGDDWQQPPGTSLPEMDANEYLPGFIFSFNSSYDYAGDAIIVGASRGTYWKSTDKGYNWTRHSSPLADLGRVTSNVAMKDESTFMLAGDIVEATNAGETPVTFATTDGGDTWIAGEPGMTVAATHYLPNSEGVFIMVGHNNFGWGNEGTAITYDYGETWEQLDNTSIIAIDFIDENTGIGACCNNIWPTANGQIHLWDFELPTPTEESITSSSIRLMPNPVSDQLTVLWDDKINAPFYRIEIFATNGQTLFSEKYRTMDRIIIDTEFLPNGIYSLRVTGGEKSVVGKFVKG